jgi:hypothetical protein
MANPANSGPLGGSTTNRPVIDSGTHCLQASPISGSLELNIPGPLLIGMARREPGKNFDGTPAEDILFADSPAQSSSITNDPMFSESDATLNAYMIQLMESLSIGDMEKVALEMQDRFSKGTGGTYTNLALDKEIANNSAFTQYHYHFLNGFKVKLKKANYNPTKMAIISMELLDFSSFWDKVTGLGITIHQVWSAKAELINYRADKSTGFWHCELLYTFYDHFGLDWPDIVKNGDRHFPQYVTGDCFKAWYILQHYRSAKPFIVIMKRTVFIAGKLE